MDNASNHSKTWSDAEIRMYLNGELSPGERHDLERAALDDPFLADALEGLMTAPPADTGIDDLRSRLAARVEKKQRRLSVGWIRRPALRSAAVVIGLVGIGLTAYYTLFDRRRAEENAGLAKTITAPAQTAPVSPPPAQTPQPAPAATDSTVAAANRANTAASIPSSLYAKADKPAAAKKRLDDNDYRKAEKEAIADKSPADDNAGKEVNLSRDSLIALRDIAAAPQPSKAAPDTLQLYADRKVAIQQNFFQSTPATVGKPSLVLSGRVVDNNNHPLAGASVFLNNAPKTMTTTDASGYFNFHIRPRDTSQQMAVALVGYKQTLVPLNTNALTNNVIQLEEAKVGLNEVVVTGFGARRRETFAAAPSDAGKEQLDSAWQKVAPVIGKLAYLQYLDTAKRSLKLDSTIFGAERVSFQVDQKGLITEFKIEHSLSPAHDAALIQLIMAGPAWHLLRGRKGRAVVSLDFP